MIFKKDFMDAFDINNDTDEVIESLIERQESRI
jgi:hypothetical protein